ncbi:MAG TPA: hypothetical protein VIV55_11045 [Flavobacterium sp.]
MRILFLCPDYFGIHKLIEKTIQKQFNCELTSIIFKDYQYKNSWDKALNFLSKTFLKKNLKRIWASNERIKDIKPEDYFDYVFMICPDFLINKDLKYITDKTLNPIVYFWDSFDNIPRYERTLPFFKTKYSFERKDTIKYNLNFLTNFYHNSGYSKSNEIDLFFIGTYDSRFLVIKEILDIVKRKSKISKIILQCKNPKVIDENKDTDITFIQKPIPIEETEKIFSNSKIILDVQKTIQQGLTFRVFEAMGFRKKLITTNTDIINYDFYNPNNIFVWTEDTKDIPDAFFETDYEELPEAIFKKYSIESWLKTIFTTKN